MDTVAFYVFLALLVLGAVVIPSWRELRVRYRRRAVARDLELEDARAVRHAVTQLARRREHDLGVPRRARIVALHVLSESQRRVRVDTDDAA